jgi:CRISPR/Cas system endoribonuclease Cas6 (RAMP superfamily)
MKLLYKKIGFTLSFAKTLVSPVPLAFVFRSIIGSHLHRMCCIAPNTVCGNCMFSPSCIYGSIFESVIPKDNQVLLGRNRISHPIIIETKPFMETDANTLTIYLVFIGSSIASLPYFYTALKKGGESGILKQRAPFGITDVFSGEKSLLVNNETIDTSFEPDVWEYDIDDKHMVRGDILVQILSPLRFKVGGCYSSRLIAEDFAHCLHRRTQTLCSQYGNNDFPGDIGYQFREKWALTENSLTWKDFTHYSTRQKGAMKLGGICGFFTLSGEFSAYEQAILRFAEIFHAGKNTNFGLGQISIWGKKVLSSTGENAIDL